MNVIQIAGHLGSDPEVRFTPSGQKVVTFRMATNSRRGGKDETTWWRVTIWGERFDKMLPYLKKGSAVIVVGEMHKPEIFTGRDGSNQVSMEITAEMIRFSPFGRGGAGHGRAGSQQQSNFGGNVQETGQQNTFTGNVQETVSVPGTGVSGGVDDNIPF